MPTINENIALTFNDVLLVPQKSDVLPAKVKLTTRLTRNIQLKIPIISADMDTVTEHRMAIALALEGGIGIIHKNLTPNEQAEEVRKVKRFRNGFIHEPVTLGPDDSILKAVEIKETLGYKNIPITDTGNPNGILLGMLTDDDYSKKHWDLQIKERMTPYEKLFVIEDGITLEEATNVLLENKLRRLLVVNNKEEHRLVSLITKIDVEKSEQYPLASKDQNKRLMVGAAVGPSKDFEERFEKLVKAGVDVIAVSTAHGHSSNVINAIKWVKQNYDIEVIGGNVVTAEGVKDLVEAGADAIKVGIGPGSICTTRVVAGIGVPQISAVMNCVEEARKTNTPIIADGGICYSGDIAKALGAGAETVMLGSLLAGVEESPGETIHFNGKVFKSYRGMGSEGALNRGSKERYSLTEKQEVVPQGVEGRVSYKGNLSKEIYQLIGGVKASFGFVGAPTMVDFHTKAKFIRITSAGERESHPHDITITKESSNYSR